MQCQCSNVIEDYVRQIQELKQVLDDFDIHLCTQCHKYRNLDNFSTCVICDDDYCEQCINRCADCEKYHCLSCSQIESTGDNMFHLKTCNSCQGLKCISKSCFVCDGEFCRGCVHQCLTCGKMFCLSCFRGNICSSFSERCRQCHFKIHTYCYKHEDFRYLTTEQQSQILTLLLVLNRKSTIIMPPKYIKEMIFRYVIHAEPKVIAVSEYKPRVRRPMARII